MGKKQKLELTWVGKDEKVKLEPRVLVENGQIAIHRCWWTKNNYNWYL